MTRNVWSCGSFASGIEGSGRCAIERSLCLWVMISLCWSCLFLWGVFFIDPSCWDVIYVDVALLMATSPPHLSQHRSLPTQSLDFIFSP